MNNSNKLDALRYLQEISALVDKATTELARARKMMRFHLFLFSVNVIMFLLLDAPFSYICLGAAAISTVLIIVYDQSVRAIATTSLLACNTAQITIMLLPDLTEDG
jgi:hypothetical protein